MIKLNISKYKVPDPAQVYVKSPLNYIGGKYKMLARLMPLFPDKIHTFVDLFAGGCDVCCNVLNADMVYANDINNHVIDIYKAFQEIDIISLLDYIDAKIQEYGLSMTNKEGYLKLRDDYNKSKDKNPLDLYVLVCYAFNYQFRFNNAHEFNSSFGKDRSSFNERMRSNLIKFHDRIQNISFSALNFKNYDFSRLDINDFVYADPPYLISLGSYNDGKRGFEGWSAEEDECLFKVLDDLNKHGVRFALSNVTEHKGMTNNALINWASQYHVHDMNYNYSNSSYHKKQRNAVTKEVLVTNY